MEAAAIGIAKTALNSVVKTAITSITNEIGLLLGVQEELFFIKEELEMMQGFLQAASTEKEKGIIVTIWVKQVQELAFDVEDCLQEASVDLMKKSCLPIMCSVKKRDHIAKKICMLKTRIEDVSKRNLRYQLIKGNGGHTIYDENASIKSIANVEALLVGLDEPKRELVQLILKENGDVISVVGMGGLGKTTLVREVFGCQELRNEFNHFAWVTVQHPFNKEEFIESLAKKISYVPNENNTELLSKEQREKKVTEYLKNKKYLIVLDDLSSLSEWDKIKDVLPMVNGSRIVLTTRLRPLAESISHPSDNIYEIRELSEKDAFDLFFKAVYKTPNYRLVIDHRKMKDDPPDESKCDMKYGTGSTEIIEEDSDVQKECLAITITEDMKAEAGLIIKSCGRLPLAIVTIGSYLSTKPTTSVVWKTMHDHLSSELAHNPNLGVVNNILTSSYDGLHYHLKPSLLYLSVFHNHKEIRRSRIIRRWMADGYLMDDRKKTAEEVGKSYFYDLMGRNLIQPSQMSTIINGDVKRCNIHDMMYELILAKAEDENMVSVLKDENLITMTDKVRHLVITGGPCTGGKVLEKVKLSHMRSLSIFGKVGDYLKYSRMKLVRVLDLEGTINLNDRDLRSLGKLRHLKYLGLRGTHITKLPNSLGKLNELETLDIRGTAVVKLPTGLTELHKLSYLRAGWNGFHFITPIGPIYRSIIRSSCIMEDWVEKYVNNCPQTIRSTANAVSGGILVLCLLCHFLSALPCLCVENFELYKLRHHMPGVMVPRGIGKLRSLNTFGAINIGGSKSLAKEMQNLTNLCKLAVNGFTKENGEILGKVIDGLKHLRSLVLQARDDLGLKCCLNYVSSPPKYLRSLKLYSPLGELPDYISSLENLEKIHLRETKLTGGIKAIEKLPNLKILYLMWASFEEDVKELCFGESTFPMLQVMNLDDLYPELEWVSIEATALKRLERLKIRVFRHITKGGVSGLDFLVQLREMVMVGFSGDNEINRTFVRNIKEQLKKVPKKPVLRVTKK